MNNNIFLLSDEKNISQEDMQERIKVYNEIKDLPEDFFSKLRHLQPQIGCLNACRICSKYASTNMAFWAEKRQRNVISAIKVASYKYKKEKPFIVWNRPEHRNGVIFSYLDNDIGNYYYLKSFIKLCYEELGVETRISTVGYSKYNERLNKMHKEINSSDLLPCLGGVRLSFTPYECGWVCSNNQKYSRKNYIEDMTNFLKVYKSYYKYAGSGSRKFCVELRYKPLVVKSNVYVFNYNEHFIISSCNYLYISKEQNIKFNVAQISDPFDHSIVLNQKPQKFLYLDLKFIPKSINELIQYLDMIDLNIQYDKGIVDVYKLENRDGEYYSINPSLINDCNYGINFYPLAKSRTSSGYIVVERFLLNAIAELKKQKQKEDNFTWEDVDEVLNICRKNAINYKATGKVEKSNYILNELLPIVEAYVYALKKADYMPENFFDKNFTIDTGIICNLGRAISEFGGLTGFENEPLTPTHERNYGMYNSKMKQEDSAWRLSCEYNNEILIEKLELKNTATDNGQMSYQKRIKLKNKDEQLNFSSLKTDALIPGQVNPNTIYFYKEFGKYGFLASYSEHGFYKDGIFWKTLEHYYQAQKFDDKKVIKKIIDAKTPKEASMIGRDRNNHLKSNWETIKLDIMEEGLYNKYMQNKDICQKLLNTGNRKIVEATVKEFYWGCGIDGTGENQFGMLLVKVRNRIRKELKLKEKTG